MCFEDREAQRILRVYSDYAAGPSHLKWSPKNRGNQAILRERSAVMVDLLSRAELRPLANKHILDVGCGAGGLLRELIELDASPSLLLGVDLIEARVEAARKALPSVDIRVADARSLPCDSESFDLVSVFTVFSSILDLEVAQQIATEIRRVVKRGGAVLWYDFQFNNPQNKNVRGIKRQQVEALFLASPARGRRSQSCRRWPENWVL